MKTKQIINDKEKIIAGLNKAADVVKSTMGGQGKTVIISTNDEREKLRFTKDGVSVAKAIKLDDPIEDIGAQILISAANKTVELCGDGTTLTSVLLQALINETIKLIQSKLENGENIDINFLIKDLEYSIGLVIEELLKQKHTVENVFHVKSIASTSANSLEVGTLFEEIYSQTGLDALLSLEKSENKTKTYYDITKGIMFDSNTGWAHSSFMTNKDTEQIIYEDAYVHIDDSPITRLTDFYDELLGKAIKNNIPLIIIAPKFSDAFIRVCSMNKVNQGAPICLVKSPGFGHALNKNVDDIRAFLSEDGFVDKFMADAYKFILYNEDTPYLNDRIKQLESLRDNAVEWYDEKDYNERLYKLKGATAVIYAGGITPEAQSEEYDRLEDAIGAVKTAVKYGYVEGGGLALFRCAINNDIKLNKIIRNICFAPLTQILSNANVDANIDSADVKGFNVKTMQYENFIESGIIDPVNVIIAALQNALANTKLLINNDYILYNEYKN